MGIRGEVFSSKVILKNRSYFFNVKENRLGNLYLNIVESKNKEGSGFERQSVILFEEDLQEFLKGFDSALRILEKSVKEKKRNPAQNSDAQNLDTKKFDAKPYKKRDIAKPYDKKGDASNDKPRQSGVRKDRPNEKKYGKHQSSDTYPSRQGTSKYSGKRMVVKIKKNVDEK
ncbi:MAG: PUR family DNA/RNA-binding protein [Termitinemataceae bacterium]|nr:MAG: PUR family DNA/RNA-binding protein [Termitinemataceae bacterium]